MAQMLLDGEATDAAPLLSISIAKLSAGTITAKELVFDVDREIADPAGDPDEVMVGAHRPVDQHLRRRPSAVLVREPPPQIEQHYGEVLIKNALGSDPIDQEPTVFKTLQDTLDLILLSFMPERLHSPEHGQ